MSTVGIIAEYNPFHQGHEYHIRAAKELTGCDNCVVVMSGNFVQRGEPAIFNKYERSRAALEGGADLVIELPSVYATSSANFFSLGAVSLLDSLGIVDYLCFGSECGDIDKLTEYAQVLKDEPQDYKFFLKEAASLGFNNAKARQYALDKINIRLGEKIESNDILGIEYIKALMTIGSSIKPVCIKRQGAAYNDPKLQPFSSALALRNHYENNRQEFMHLYPIFLQDIWPFILYKINENIAFDTLEDYMDLNRESVGKIKKYLYESKNLNTFLDKLASKETTLGHEKRSLIHILLDMKKNDFDNILANGLHLYIKVLGFKKNKSNLLKNIKDRAGIPLITNSVDGLKIIESIYSKEQELSMDKADCEIKRQVASNMYKKEIYANQVYRILQNFVYQECFKHEFEEKIIII